jgi:hypothetical protein
MAQLPLSQLLVGHADLLQLTTAALSSAAAVGYGSQRAY